MKYFISALLIVAFATLISCGSGEATKTPTTKDSTLVVPDSAKAVDTAKATPTK